MTYACYRAVFAQEEFEKCGERFWAMPQPWQHPSGAPLLRLLYTGGGIGAISIVPILGQFVHAGKKEWALSQEELARLAGVAPDTVQTARLALQSLELASTRTRPRDGVALLHWTLSSALAAPRSNGGFTSHYFYFPARLVYGGNWARLTGIQRALYLAAAGRAEVFSGPPEQHPVLRRAGIRPSPDMLPCASKHRPEPWLRLARVSYSELQQDLGASRSALADAVADLKCDGDPNGSRLTDDRLRHSPIAVYRPAKGSLLFHFRDHVDPWPWDVLNRGGAGVSETCCEFSKFCPTFSLNSVTLPRAS